MRIIPLGVGMIKRDVAGFVLDNASWFPVVSVTGPRQSGKSTLVRSLFSDYAYVNLEDRPTYERVMAGPSDFIHERPPRRYDPNTVNRQGPASRKFFVNLRWQIRTCVPGTATRPTC